MAYVTKEDGVRDFNSHDAAGFFAKIDRMNINSDFSLTRVPKDPKSPGLLALNDSTKWPPAYINGYVDAYNLKYHNTTATPYAVVESSKNTYTATDPTKTAVVGIGIMQPSDYGIVGGTPSSLGPISNSTTQAQIDAGVILDNRTIWGKYKWWIIIAAAVAGWFVWKKLKKRRKL